MKCPKLLIGSNAKEWRKRAAVQPSVFYLTQFKVMIIILVGRTIIISIELYLFT